jgi:hypothetical protein
MMLRDRLVDERLGHEFVGTLHYPVPATLGLGLMVLGWWFARGRRAAADVS